MGPFNINYELLIKIRLENDLNIPPDTNDSTVKPVHKDICE